MCRRNRIMKFSRALFISLAVSTFIVTYIQAWSDWPRDRFVLFFFISFRCYHFWLYVYYWGLGSANANQLTIDVMREQQIRRPFYLTTIYGRNIQLGSVCLLASTHCQTFPPIPIYRQLEWNKQKKNTNIKLSNWNQKSTSSHISSPVLML